MTVVELPHPLPGGGRNWQLVDATRDTLHTPPAAGGIAQVALDQVPAGERWFVQRISVQASSAGVAFVAYYNSINPANVADSTQAGDADVADEHQPILLNETDTLLLVWSGCPDGTLCYANVQRTVYRLS
jgi:hypothetical protein